MPLKPETTISNPNGAPIFRITAREVATGIFVIRHYNGPKIEEFGLTDNQIARLARLAGFDVPAPLGE